MPYCLSLALRFFPFLFFVLFCFRLFYFHLICGPSFNRSSMCLSNLVPSLRNLVSEHECGRVFPAGVRSGSPSRDAVNWLSSLFSGSVETRQRYGWLRMVFPGAGLFRAPIWCPTGGGGTREVGSIVAESLVALYRVSTHQIWRRRRAARSATSQGSAEPLYARIKGANREVSEGKSDF